MMKRMLGVLVAAGILFSSGTAGWCRDAVGPVAQPVGMNFRFDPVPEGTLVEHVFTIRNPGEETLRIDSVKTG
jgi:hypothetical protein